MKIINFLIKHYRLSLFLLMCIAKNDVISIAVLLILVGQAAWWAVKAAAEVEAGHEFR